VREILVADDSKTIQLWMHENLPSWGFKTRIVGDGLAALSELSRPEHPSLVLLDWEMPGLTGPEICRKLRAAEKGKAYTYIILVTQKSAMSDIVFGLEAGADDYLIKPFEPLELRSRLDVGFRVIDYDRESRHKEFITRLECYNALTELAETRDQEGADHLRRISFYADMISRKLGLHEEFIGEIRLFAPMHDIGKVGIPDYVLHAPRKFTPEEMSLMKTHTELGWQILEGKESLTMAAEIALSHHEMWNGKGYPRGLQGESIPLSGRIVALCDVYDALRSKRVYKETWTHNDARDWILSQRGQHFDPRISDAFKALEGDFAMVYGDLV
jgi:putative two-component system response regulator